jgi:hypothetical protein
MQLAVTRANIALHPAIVKHMPVLGGNKIGDDGHAGLLRKGSHHYGVLCGVIALALIAL